jgi:hypothetical protein
VAYELWISEIGQVAEFEKFWTDLTLRHKFVSWRNFTMKTLKTLNTEIVFNYLRFLPVTHMISSDAWFDGQKLSTSGHGAEPLDRLDTEVKSQV